MSASALSRLSAVGRVPDDTRRAAPQQKKFDTDNTERTVGYVMLDCSGTTMDRYVDAPAIVFVDELDAIGRRRISPRNLNAVGITQQCSAARRRV